MIREGDMSGVPLNEAGHSVEGKQQGASTGRVLYFDVLNIVACVAVVAMHCNTMVHTYRPGMNWVMGMGIESVCYFAVPIFFMLSGATLMRYRERYSTKTFLKKRFLKTLVPLLFFSIAIYCWRYGYEARSSEFGVRQFLIIFFSNGIESTYWFFFPLFALYLSMPVLSLLANNKKILWYMVAVSFALQSFFPYVFDAVGIDAWNSDLSLPVAGNSLMWALLGFLLAETDLSKRNRLIIYAFGLFGLAFRFAYTCLFSFEAGVLDRTFFGTLSFPSVMYATAVFVWFKQRDWGRIVSTERFVSLLSRVSSCSFGVYLIHDFILFELVFERLGVPDTSIFLRTAGPIILYCCCLAIVFIGKKTPGVKVILP